MLSEETRSQGGRFCRPSREGTVKGMNRIISKARQFCGIGALVLLISFIPLPVAAATPAQAPKYADVVVYPGGTPFGVRFGANEVTVLRLTRFASSGKEVSPAIIVPRLSPMRRCE